MAIAIATLGGCLLGIGLLSLRDHEVGEGLTFITIAAIAIGTVSFS